MEWPLIVPLALVCFFFYWISGGVFFACVALLRLVRLRKVRFSCLFTLLAAFCALAAAWGGVNWLARTTGCLVDSNGKRERILEIVSCGFGHFLLSALAGFALLIIFGFFLLKISSWKDRGWLTNFAERLKWDNEEEEEES